MMNKGKHLTLDERKQIETLLNRKHSFKSIGRELSRDCTTIAKEVSAHVIFKRTAIRGVTCNNCKHRFQCTQHHLCRDCATPRQSKKCHFCKLCNFVAKSMKLTSALHWKRLRMSAIPVRSVLLPALWKSISMMLFQRTKSTPIHFLNLAPD